MTNRRLPAATNPVVIDATNRRRWAKALGSHGSVIAPRSLTYRVNEEGLLAVTWSYDLPTLLAEEHEFQHVVIRQSGHGWLSHIASMDVKFSDVPKDGDFAEMVLRRINYAVTALKCRSAKVQAAAYGALYQDLRDHFDAIAAHLLEASRG